jgi:hypothetical protein
LLALAAVVGFGLLAGLAVPAWRTASGLLVALVALWIGATLVQTGLHLRRFHRELRAGQRLEAKDNTDGGIRQ